MKILLTGATGYVGGRLLNRLMAEKFPVRCLVRRPEEFKAQVSSEVEVFGGDMLDPGSLEGAFEGIEQAFYLIHSMGSSESFAKKDRTAARNFADRAAKAGVKRIIYLGGLGQQHKKLSLHLRSRQEVGEILRSFSVPVTEFRASIIIGSGSLSFEMVRSLVERLPWIIAPKWVAKRAQPIAIADVLEYLIAALRVPALPNATSQIYEIGGAEAVSYADMMREYAKQRKLKRRFLLLPVLTPRMSSWWLGLVTPIYARIGRKLIDSVRYSTIVRNPIALKDFSIRPMTMEKAVAQALQFDERKLRQSHWTDAFSSAVDLKQWGGVRFGTKLVDSRTIDVNCSPEQAFRPIEQIGGARGWYFLNWLWIVRAWLDLFVGGVGFKRGRRDADAIRVGDIIDWWRVEAYEKSRRLRLSAEMRLPGKAWLEFEVTPQGTGSRIHQTAIFYPRGLWGIIYWYGIYPLHQVIFMGMLKKIAETAEKPSKK